MLRSQASRSKQILWGWSMTMLVYLVCVLSPWGENLGQVSFLTRGADHLTVLAQSTLVIFVSIVIGCLLAARWPNATLRTIIVVTSLLPAFILINSAVVQWLGVPLFSEVTFHVITNHVSTLLPFTTKGMLFVFVAIVFVLGISWVFAYQVMSKPLLQNWVSKCSSLAWFGMLSVAALFAFAPQRLSSSTPNQHTNSTRWPFAVIQSWYQKNEMSLETSATDEEIGALRGHRLEPYVLAKERQFRLNTVIEREEHSSATRPDVLIIVLESLRRELLSPQIMPHTSRLAAKGMTLRQHFSGGNATSLGIFSLVTGLEATWFYRSEPRHSPAMNDLFRQAGYEVGCFAGQNDWEPFQMEGFMNDRVYDSFYCEPRDGLRADRLAIARTNEFLTSPTEQHPRHPRLAMLFLYSTHAPFYVDEHVAAFEPAAEASFLMPFTESMRPAVWNRYCNAARSLDVLIEPLLTTNRIIVVTGDHGESFLEDGSIGHGTRLSRQQTMTPAVVYIPGRTATVVNHPTMHADILPTMLAAAGIEVSNPGLFDGIDLCAASRNTQDKQNLLHHRVFAVANYVGREIGLLDAATYGTNQTFMYQLGLSLFRWRLSPLGPLDERGNSLPVSNVSWWETGRLMDCWLRDRLNVTESFMLKNAKIP